MSKRFLRYLAWVVIIGSLASIAVSLTGAIFIYSLMLDLFP